jgi:ribosomal protein L34
LARKSPFISVAGTLRLAGLICAEYIKKGCQGIKLHVIQMSGEGWDPHKQRIFRVTDLARQFGFRMRKAYKSEYLIESEIPEACVIETMDISGISDIPRNWEHYMAGTLDALDWKKQRRDFRKLIEAARRMALKNRLKPQKAERSRHGGYESRKRTKDFNPITERYY